MTDGGKSIWKHEYVEFCIEILLTALVFVVIAAVALALQGVISFFDGKGMSPFVVKCLTYAEYAILVGDLLYLICAVLKHVAVFAIKSWKHVQESYRQ